MHLRSQALVEQVDRVETGVRARPMNLRGDVLWQVAGRSFPHVHQPRPIPGGLAAAVAEEKDGSLRIKAVEAATPWIRRVSWKGVKAHQKPHKALSRKTDLVGQTGVKAFGGGRIVRKMLSRGLPRGLSRGLSR